MAKAWLDFKHDNSKCMHNVTLMVFSHKNLDLPFYYDHNPSSLPGHSHNENIAIKKNENAINYKVASMKVQKPHFKKTSVYMARVRNTKKLKINTAVRVSAVSNIRSIHFS